VTFWWSSASLSGARTFHLTICRWHNFVSIQWFRKGQEFKTSTMYNDLVMRIEVPFNCYTWKAKIPLKINIFIWYLRKGVILTKYNLVKRQWKGCTRCCFCNRQKKYSTPLFWMPNGEVDVDDDKFYSWYQRACKYVSFLWSLLRSFSKKKQRNQVLIGVAVFCWALWLSGTFWIRSWSLLSKEEERSIFYGRMSLVRDNGVGVPQQEWMECPTSNYELAVVFFNW
jgi:hypothetical protein